MAVSCMLSRSLPQVSAHRARTASSAVKPLPTVRPLSGDPVLWGPFGTSLWAVLARAVGAGSMCLVLPGCTSDAVR